MNKYEKWIASFDTVVNEPGFSRHHWYCSSCAIRLWRHLVPQDTDLAFFEDSGRVYRLDPEDENATCSPDKAPDCGH